jgi:hypothetical protein
MTSKIGGRFGVKLLLLIIIIEIGIYEIGLGLYGSAPFLPPPGPNPPLGPRATIIGVWAVAAASGLTPVIALTLARKRMGELNAAAWLVFYGTIVIVGEHAAFAIGYSAAKRPSRLGPALPSREIPLLHVRHLHHSSIGADRSHSIQVAQRG